MKTNLVIRLSASTPKSILSVLPGIDDNYKLSINSRSPKSCVTPDKETPIQTTVETVNTEAESE